MNSGTLDIAIANRIATLTFSHPASNSLPGDLLYKMTSAFNDLAADSEVQVIVLKSDGDRAFCAGASFDELLAINNSEQGTKFFMGFAHLINSMRTCGKIIIGAVQGKAVGGGVGLVAACDYVVASEEASVKLSELFIGIGAFVIEPVVNRKIGKAAFCNLTLEATEWHSATWAHSNGLFSKITDTKEHMLDEVDALANRLASYHPEALFEMKKVFWEGTDHWDILLAERAEISGALVLTDFTKNTLLKWKK